MYFDGITYFKSYMHIGSYLIVLLVRLILIIDSVKPANSSSSRQMCAKLQSMLSFGRYQTFQISSNVTYIPRFYTQNFLAYSSIDDLLIFIEPKQQIHVYNAQTIQLIVNLTNNNVVMTTSTTSLTSDSHHELYFLYETPSETNLIAFRLCQVRFNMLKFLFEDQFCLENIHIQFDQPDLRVNGLTIKRNHAGTKKSLLFISTDLGLIYTVFDTHSGSIIGESTIMNETLNEGSIVLTSSNIIYYASKQEHLIYELHIQRDFRLRYGKIIKTNAIKHPFGLITDECNHLYIATRSMILIMYVQNRATIRSVFSKASDLPITLERLNSTTYVYATVRKYAAKSKPYWMFNFLYFTDPEKGSFITRHPAINLDEKLDFNDTKSNNYLNPILYPLYYWTSLDTNATKTYVQFTSTIRRPFGLFRKKKKRKPTKIIIPINQNGSTIDGTKYFTRNPFNGQSMTDFIDDDLDFDDNVDSDSPELNNQSFNNDIQLNRNLSNDHLITFFNMTLNNSKQIETISSNWNSPVNISSNDTISIDDSLFSDDEIDLYFHNRSNLSKFKQIQIETYLAKQSSIGYKFLTKFFNITTMPTKLTSSNNRNVSFDENLQTQININNNTSFDFNLRNHTIEIADTNFSDDEIQSYIDQQSSTTNQTIFPSYWKITKSVTRSPSIHNNTQSIIEQLSFDWNVYLEQFNQIINMNGTIISKNDLQSYFQGRSNLSEIQERLIQNILAQQSSSFYNIFSQYSKTTTQTTNTLSFNETSFTLSSIINRLMFNENLLLETYFRYVNDSNNTNGLLFSYDDLKSYLRGNANLSTDQESQIQAYLIRQWTHPYNLSLTSTKKPQTTVFSESTTSSEYWKIEKISVTDTSQFINHTEKNTSVNRRTTDYSETVNEIFFSDDDIQSYLQGRTNLSLIEQAQIQAYLIKHSSSSRYSTTTTTTKEPIFISKPNYHITSHSWKSDNLSLIEDIRSENYSQQLLPSNLQTHNHSIDSDNVLFSDDNDLQFFLVSRSNLSNDDINLIQEYLSRRKSLNRIGSRNKTSLPITTRTSNKTLHPIYLYNTTQSGVPFISSSPVKSSYLNSSIASGKSLFSDDNLKSNLQDRTNLSVIQQQQIQTNLSKQLSSSSKPSSQYSTRIRIPTRISTSDYRFYSNFPRTQSRSQTTTASLKIYEKDRSSFNFQFENHTIDSNKTSFVKDDLRSFLITRSNLSKSDIDKIQAYISGQRSFNRTRDQKRTTSTNRLYTSSSRTRLNYQNWITQLQNYFTKSPLEMNFFNFSTDIEQFLFSEDDLRSYLQGATNLTLAQEQQIQEYLSKYLPSVSNESFSYLTSTKRPIRTSISDRRLSNHSLKPGNLSLIDNMESFDYSEERLSTDIISANTTIDSDETMFSDDDDLRSYLETRSNLSHSDIDIIQDYLSSRRSFNQTKYQNKTSLSIITSTLKTSIRSSYQYKTTIQSKVYSTQSSPFNGQELLFSENDLMSYLQGRANLSLAQEKQIQAYLSKQTSSSYNRSSQYSTSTKQTQRIFKSTTRIHPDSQRTRIISSMGTTTSKVRSQNLLTTTSPLTNNTIQSNQIIFSNNDDLRSFLQTRSNLSKNSIDQIQQYLSRRKSFNQTQFATSISTHDDQYNTTQSNIYVTQLTFNWKYFNFSNISEELLFSEEDLKSYLQGQANLTLAQQEQIQTFLSKHLSSSNNSFPQYSTSTIKPSRTSTFHHRLSLTDRVSSGNSSQELLSSDYKFDNTTMDFDETLLFNDDDDLRSYLIAQSNLSKSDLDKIEAYLSEIGLFNRTDDQNKTNLSTSTSTTRNSTLVDESKYLYLFTNSDGLLLSDDDLKTYLQNRTNLSLIQQEQIRIYLSKQTLSSHSSSVRYPITTKKPRSTSVTDTYMYPNFSRTKTPHQSDSTTLENDFRERPSFDYQSNDQNADSNEMQFLDDDQELRSFLQARSNLSRSDLDRIQAYLSGQKFFNPRKIRNKTHVSKTVHTSTISTYSNSQNPITQTQRYFTKSSFASKYFNVSIDEEKLLFSEDDLKSYLQGRANLTLAQERQIQEFLAKQILLDNNIFSDYLMSTTQSTETFTIKHHSHDYIDLEDNAKQSSDEYSQLVKLTSPSSHLQTDRFSNASKQTFLDQDGKIRDDDDNIKESLHIFDDKENRQTTTLSTPWRNYFSNDYDQQNTIAKHSDDQIRSSHLSTQTTNMGSISSNNSSEPALSRDPAVTNADHTSHFILDSLETTTDIMPSTTLRISSETSTEIDQKQISTITMETILKSSTDQRLMLFENQSSLINTSDSYTNTKNYLNDRFIHRQQTSTLSTSITHETTTLSQPYDHDNSNIFIDTTSQSSSSSLLITSNIFPSTYPFLSSTMSSTALPITYLSHSSTPSHFSSVFTSTKSSEHTSLSSPVVFSESERSTTITSLSTETTLIDSESTTISSYSTLFPSYTDSLQSSQQFSSMQTTDIAITSDISKQKSMTTPFETSTSFLFTTYPSHTKLTISSKPLLTTDKQTLSTIFEQYISTFLLARTTTSSIQSTQSSRIFSTFFLNTDLDFTSTKSTNEISSSSILTTIDETSSSSVLTTIEEENLVESSNHRFVETTEISPLSTMITSLLSETQEELLTSTELLSTTFPYYSKSKILSTIQSTTLARIPLFQEFTLSAIRDNSPVLTTSTTTMTTTPMTTTSRQRSRRPKTTTTPILESSTSATTTILPFYLTTTIFNRRSTTSTPISTWSSTWNYFERQEQQTDVKPPTTSTETNLILTNDLLNQIFNNISSSSNSSEKTVFFNLVNYPPSTWNLSLNSNESIILDVLLPPPMYSPYHNTTTNLTFTNIEANRFATTITGIPVHLQVDHVQTRQFSLTMNATDDNDNRNQTIKHSSDVIIGHVKSEQFELTLTKSDSMHVHVQQVDSETAELYLDSNFCTNESSLEINLNLSKNGTIRYGKRKPIHIGAVFTRVHMLKQSCDREQPLTLFFDICERENPCLNGGQCQSVFPNYNDPLYIPNESGHVGYKCQCPTYASGEHCQHLEYPLGYCLNDGTLFEIIDRFNKTHEQCICPMGFRGKHCEENIDNCIDITCSDHGVCEDGIETYKCLCFDGFFGFHCERSNVQAILLRAASRSFGVIAILLIVGIAGLVVASDIHTYLTRKQQRDDLLKKKPRVTSELFENSVLLLGFSDAPMEMNDLSNVEKSKYTIETNVRQIRRIKRNRRPKNYREITVQRPLTSHLKKLSRHHSTSVQN